MTDNNASQIMRGHIASFPDLWREAWRIARKETRIPEGDLANAVFCGMGGSSIGGALTVALAEGTSAVPLCVNRRYRLPGFAGTETLAVFTSYSGNTEETLSAYDDAGRRGCRRYAVTSGGGLGERAERDGVWVVEIPGGLPPRAALPYTLVPVLALARSCGFLHFETADTEKIADMLAEASEVWQTEQGLASEIADKLQGRIALIYSGSGLTSAANLRWRGQIQENAKTPAFGNLYPELNHNEIEGWDSDNELLSQIAVVEWADRDDHPAVRSRMDITRSLLEPKAGAWVRLDTRGGSPLARLMYAVYLGDWVSFHLSQRYGADPLGVPLIDTLKSRLAGA